MNARIIVFANQKGGVGKTTCCINLAAAMKDLNVKVLLVDLDPQGNATMGSGLNKLTLKYHVGDVLQENIGITEVIAPTPWFDILPSNIELTAAEINLLQHDNRQFKLSKHLSLIAANYDLVFIDCPPSLNILTINALVAANSILIPMQCEYYALEGLSALMDTMDGVRKLNKNLRIEGIIRTMYDARNKLCKDVSVQLIEHFGTLVYNAVIPRNIRLAETPSHGKPIFAYDRHSAGAKAYTKLAKEFFKNSLVMGPKFIIKHKELDQA